MNLGRACNSVQGATATVAFAAMSAMWNLQLTESKRVLLGSNPTLSANHRSCVFSNFAGVAGSPRVTRRVLI